MRNRAHGVHSPERATPGCDLPPEHQLDEWLEQWWAAEEGGNPAPGPTLPPQALERLRAAGLADGGEPPVLTPSGRARAESIIRRHRLSERLLTDLMDLGEDHVESAACQFEHILSPEVADSICTLLGHPPRCPHGRPIPPGDCCKKPRRELQPVIVPLTELSVGAMGRIVFLTPRFPQQLDRLGALGVVPGTRLRLHQKRPAFVVQIGETELALDGDIAREIYVRRVSEANGRG